MNYTTSTTPSTTKTPELTLHERFCAFDIWWSSLACIGAVWVLGFLLILLRKIYKYTHKDAYDEQIEKKRRRGQDNLSAWGSLTYHCEIMASGGNLIGKLLILLVFFFSIGCLVIYVYLTYNLKIAITTSDMYNHCATMERFSVILWMDFAFNVFFLFHFIIRLLATNNSLVFWCSVGTLADFFTVIPMILMTVLNVHVTAFRFFRALRLINLPDILVYLRLLRNRSAIRIVQLVSLIISLWLFGAGVIHLLENMGDWWQPPDKANINAYSFFECVYFMIITLSTVGYGDMSPRTYLGRVFIMVFIICVIGIFAGAIPEVAAIVGDNQLYSGSYNPRTGQKHVVITGNVNYNTIRNFIKEFLHPDRSVEEKNIKLVFLGGENPNLKLRAMMKRNNTKMEYLQGTVMESKDLERVKIRLAEAVIILSDIHSDDPENTDWINIMRVIAVKDLRPETKIIVQILQYQNKAYLLNIPGWNSSSTQTRQADQAVCLSELKMGLMAQNCEAPGFATFVANLLTLSNSDYTRFAKNNWKYFYTRGADFEMYRVNFSSSFDDKTFLEAVDVCMSKLDVLLLAVEIQWNDNERRILVNPADNIKIQSSQMAAFVISIDEHRANRVAEFCSQCNTENVEGDAENLRACTCCKKASNSVRANSRAQKTQMSSVNANGGNPETIAFNNASFEAGGLNSSDSEVSRRRRASRAMTPQEGIHVDSTGLFHYCQARKIDDCILQHESALERDFDKHVLVCLLANMQSPTMGLCNFVMPLRSSYIATKDLKDIVFVGDAEVVKREWTAIQNFPGIYILQGSPLNRAYLRAANLEDCASCVILSAGASKSGTQSDPCLTDKEAILCTLNIKTMPRRDGSGMLGESIRLTTELNEESNVNLVDQDDEDAAEDGVFLSQPYATGRMFNVSILDSIISSTFFNPSALDLFQALVSGGATSQVEQILAEGLGMLPGQTAHTRCRFQCRVMQLPVSEPPLKTFMNADGPTVYAELFLRALRETGVICIGLFRVQELSHVEDDGKPRRRFVMCSPVKNRQLMPSDMIFCLKPLTTGEVDDNCPKMPSAAVEVEDVRL